MTLQGTMLSRIEGWAKASGNEPAIHDRNSDGTWATSTWAEYWESVRRVGKGLMALWACSLGSASPSSAPIGATG